MGAMDWWWRGVYANGALRRPVVHEAQLGDVAQIRPRPELVAQVGLDLIDPLAHRAPIVAVAVAHHKPRRRVQSL